MKFRELLEKRWFANTFAACVAVLLFIFLQKGGPGTLGNYLKPIIIGLAIAYIIDPLVRLFERKVLGFIKGEKLRRTIAMVLAFIIVIAVFAFLLFALIPQLIDSIMSFINNISVYVGDAQSLLDNLSVFAERNGIELENLIDYGNQLLEKLAGVAPRIGSAILNSSLSFGSGVANFFIALILSIYFLGSKDYLISGIKRLFHACMEDKNYESSMTFLNKCNDIMGRYIASDLLDGVIVGIVNFIFMTALGIPYATLISVIVGITNLAPTFGPIVGAVIGGFILLLVQPVSALIFIIFTIVLQTLDGYIIKPKLFGNTLGVSGLWIMVGIIVGGRMLGVIGILLAIPVVAIIDYIYHIVLEKLERRKESAKFISK